MSLISLFRAIGTTVKPQVAVRPTQLSTTFRQQFSSEPASLQTPAAADDADKLYKSIEIELRGVDPAVLKSYTTFATMAAEHLGIELGKCWALRKAEHDRMTLLKSVHIYKKHRVQYEIRTYFRFMRFNKLTGSTLDTFLEYIERNLPEGVALKVAKMELQDLPPHIKAAVVE